MEGELTVKFLIHAATWRDGDGMNKLMELNEPRLQTNKNKHGPHHVSVIPRTVNTQLNTSDFSIFISSQF